jgi:hypothetical protein
VSARLPLICLFSAFSLIAGSPVVMAVTSAPSSGQAAVMFDPRLDRVDLMRAVADADASLVRFGGLPGTVIVDMPDGGVAQLAASGAWIIADPIMLGGCQPETSFNPLSRGA